MIDRNEHSLRFPTRPGFGRAALLLPVWLLAACTIGPDYTAPKASDAPIAAQFANGGNGHSTDRQDKILWWTRYRDARLNALVAEALAQNLQVKQALERVNAANAGVLQAGGARYPLTAIVSGASRKRDSDGIISTEATLGLSGNWLIDLTGRNRRNLETALAQLDSSEANVVARKLVVTGDLVRSYVRMRGNQAEAQVARDTIAGIRKIADITQRRFERGVGTALDVQLAQARLSEAQSQLPLLLASFDTEANHIATLLARPVQEIRTALARGAPQPMGRGAVAVGVPADLIRNRYDIKATERDLAATYAQIGVAQADLYPSLTLIGSIAANSGPDTWNFGPQISLPIFNRTALRGRVARLRSEADEQYLTWQRMVILAVEQVENAQTRLRRQQQSVALLRRNGAQLKKAQDLAIISYERGVVPLQQLIDTNRLLGASRSSLAQSRTNLGLIYADLQVALGGFVE